MRELGHSHETVCLEPDRGKHVLSSPARGRAHLICHLGGSQGDPKVGKAWIFSACALQDGGSREWAGHCSLLCDPWEPAAKSTAPSSPSIQGEGEPVVTFTPRLYSSHLSFYIFSHLSWFWLILFFF